jgi:Phage integrase family
MRKAGDGAHGRRLRGLIVVLWRAGLRIQEALALAEGDLDHGRGALLVGRGKGGRRREVGMDAWGWDELQPWLELRVELPVGPLFCVLNGRTRGRQWSSAGARTELRRTAVTPGVRRTLRSASAPARPRCRNGPRRRTARRHPAPARPQQPRHHLDLPPRHRQRRDHQHGPRPPRTDDPGQHRTTALTDTRPRTCSSRKAQL